MFCSLSSGQHPQGPPWKAVRNITWTRLLAWEALRACSLHPEPGLGLRCPYSHSPVAPPITEQMGSGLGKMGVTQLAGLGSNLGHLLFTTQLEDAGAQPGQQQARVPFLGEGMDDWATT